MANARKTVRNALLRVHEDGGYSNIVWNTALEQAQLDPRDAAFATTLFYGVLERQITLDFCIAAHTKTPIRKMDPAVREALRMGVYQLLFAQGVPDRAAIHESVMLVKQSGANRFAGFVNGILRSVQRAGNVMPSVKALSPVGQLSVTYSVPEELVSHYIKWYGESLTRQLLPAFLGPRPLYIRGNPCKTRLSALAESLEKEGITPEPTAYDQTLRVASAGSLSKTKAYRNGLFHVQDPASGFACAALAPQPGMRVLDVCAAPGGKSFTLGEMMGNQGELLACDLYDHKIGLIREGAQRLGLSCVKPTLRDAMAQDDLGLFDRILCDLPCSGLGILGRKPEIRYKIDTFLDNLQDLQYGMLCNSLRFLKPGGILVFSTCTLNPRENEENVARLLGEHPFLSPHPVLPDLRRICGEPAHMINLFPHVHGTDGFFISAVRKAE